jgi:uncharacterized damage-inducible protein DinB
MQASGAYSQRIADLVVRLDEAAERLATRLERAGSQAEHAASGWTAAQVGAHVALVNDSFSKLVDGSVPAAKPAPEAFVERSWADVASGVADRVEAPPRVQPPATISGGEAAQQVRASAARLGHALANLSEERSRYCFTNPVVGTITVIQVGDWAIAHMIRHNQQAKRILNEG